MILTQHGINCLPKTPADEPIPLIGTLTNKFIFDSASDIYTDSIGHINTLKRQNTPPQLIGEFGIEVGYIYGINLNLSAKVGDYLEVELKYTLDTTLSPHARLINFSNDNYISDTAALVIWRGGESYKYWASYFSNWYPWGNTNQFKDPTLFNMHKLGIFIKSEYNMSVYLDNICILNNFYNDLFHNYKGYAKYCIGVTTSNYSMNYSLQCKRVRLFRNCIEKSV